MIVGAWMIVPAFSGYLTLDFILAGYLKDPKFHGIGTIEILLCSDCWISSDKFDFRWSVCFLTNLQTRSCITFYSCIVLKIIILFYNSFKLGEVLFAVTVLAGKGRIQ